ncbi:zf-TFIIB domain-containing protein [Methylotenera sp. L2L1]|uniref:TFIIB-type zinc ribbon-containing protein n=1 Tax=Methylotenera sp. L2L1 TaxID=1502770 RepID=UPI00056B6571|nr:zf-TFIIB domain-containing protein [Methylotenera sp. L2L1]
MKCPTCINTTLIMSERQGVEIAYCPECRGVWLDRGELDKIIDKNHGVNNLAKSATYNTDNQKYSEPTQQEHYHQKKKRKESFFEDLFDF